MVVFYVILGIVCLLGTTIVGLQGGSILVGLLYGIFGSSIFFGISLILAGQEKTQALIQNSFYRLNKPELKDVQCKKCGAVYASDRRSCPYCGYRE